jgi:peptide/nickel transport system permease protein
MNLALFIGKRLLTILITVIAVLSIAFVMMRFAPGGFFNSATIAQGLGTLALQNPHLYQQYLNMFERQYGLNQPLWRQTLTYVWHSLTFNFGTSFENPSVPIITQLKTALPISALLAGGSIVLALIIGIPLGVFAAVKRNTWIDSLLTTLSMTGQAIPAYVLGVIAVLFFGVWVSGILPVNGWGTPADAILPIVCLSAGNIGVITRYMRSSLVEGLRQEYIRTAEAKGIRYWHIVWRHGIRNSLTALVTVVGPTFAFTIVGTVWVENIFSIPGLGTLLSNAFTADDIPLAITSVYILSLMVMVMNLIVDITYGVLDPRVKLR